MISFKFEHLINIIILIIMEINLDKFYKVHYAMIIVALFSFFTIIPFVYDVVQFLVEYKKIGRVQINTTLYTGFISGFMSTMCTYRVEDMENNAKLYSLFCVGVGGMYIILSIPIIMFLEEYMIIVQIFFSFSMLYNVCTYWRYDHK